MSCSRSSFLIFSFSSSVISRVSSFGAYAEVFIESSCFFDGLKPNIAATLAVMLPGLPPYGSFSEASFILELLESA